MKIKRDIAISENGFVFNPNTGESFSVNYTGTVLLGLLKEECDQEVLCNKLLEDYQCDLLTIDKDINDFLRILNEYHLLEKNEK